MALQYNDIVANQQGKTPDQLAQQAQSVTLNQLSPATPITLPPPPPPSSNADALVSSAASTIPSIDSILKTDTTSLDTTQNSLIDRLNTLLPQSGGKTQALAQEQQNQGLPQLQKQLTDLNNQMTIGNAEYNKLQADYNEQFANLGGNQSVETKAVLGAQQAGLSRAFDAKKASKAADLALIAARAQAVSGNINTALQLAQNAVDARYAPIEDEIKIRQAQLQAIQPLLDKQQKEIALRQQVLLDERNRQIAEQKDSQKTIQNIMLQAAQSGADATVLDKIQRATNPQDAISAAAYSLGAEFRQKIVQQQFENSLALKQLAVSQGNLAVSKERLAFEKTKEAFDEAIKLAGNKGTVSLDANGNPVATPVATPIMQQAISKSNIDLISSLITDKGLASSVGPNFLSRFKLNPFSGAKQNFIAGVEELRSQLNLDKLIQAKGQGATFGALSDQELQVLANSATKLGAWVIKDKQGNVTGYNASEVDFKKELDKINNFAKLDYILKGGNPNDVGVKQLPNGKYGVLNSDGSITELE